MARRKSRWKAQARGQKRGALTRDVKVPHGRPIPARLMKMARLGMYGRKNQQRAQRAGR